MLPQHGSPDEGESDRLDVAKIFALVTLSYLILWAAFSMIVGMDTETNALEANAPVAGYGHRRRIARMRSFPRDLIPRSVQRAGRKVDKMWSSFWKDFNSENNWRFPDIAPSQLQELLGEPVVDHSERMRADWMWRRRPKLVLGEGFLGYCLVLAVGVSLPLVHQIGLLLDVLWLSISSLLIASDTVRAIRWRRDYEASLWRLIRSMRRRKTI